MINARRIEETLETVTAAALFVIAILLVSACGREYQFADRNEDGRVTTSECVEYYLDQANGMDFDEYLDCFETAMSR